VHSAIRLLLLVVLTASLFIWPVSAVLAYLLLHSSPRAWTPLAYVLIVLLVIHFPLLAWSRKRAIEGGSSLTRRGKLEIIVPPALNSLFLVIGVTYLWVTCSSRFSC
jgi:hypothetical protein